MHRNGNSIAVAAVVVMSVVLVVAKVQQANLDAGTAEPGECLNDLFLLPVHTHDDAREQHAQGTVCTHSAHAR